MVWNYLSGRCRVKPSLPGRLVAGNGIPYTLPAGILAAEILASGILATSQLPVDWAGLPNPMTNVVPFRPPSRILTRHAALQPR